MATLFWFRKDENSTFTLCMFVAINDVTSQVLGGGISSLISALWSSCHVMWWLCFIVEKYRFIWRLIIERKIVKFAEKKLFLNVMGVVNVACLLTIEAREWIRMFQTLTLVRILITFSRLKELFYDSIQSACCPVTFNLLFLVLYLILWSNRESNRLPHKMEPNNLYLVLKRHFKFLSNQTHSLICLAYSMYGEEDSLSHIGTLVSGKESDG